MSETVTSALFAGATTAGYIVIGAFFLRFWRRTRDALFLIFAIAFWLMAANQLAPSVLGIPRESQGGVFLLRLAAFVLIICGVLWKNLSRPPSR